jgi:hypothetical protein
MNDKFSILFNEVRHGNCRLVAPAAAGWAQVTRLGGTVQDGSGAVIPALRSAANDDTGLTYQQESGAEGGFTFPCFRPEPIRCPSSGGL